MADGRAATQHEVRVDGELCLVWVGHDRGATWRAYGDFRGRHIERKGRDARDALSQWTRAAEFAANE